MTTKGLPLNFISLKWKTLWLSAVLLSAIFIAFVINQKFHLNQQLLSIRSEITEDWPSQLASLITLNQEIITQDLIKVGQSTDIKHLIKHNQPSNQKLFKKKWFELQLKHQLVNYAFIDAAGQSFFQSGNPEIVQSLLENTQTRSVTHNYINCSAQCLLYIIIPIKKAKNDINALVIGASLAPIIEKFHDLSKAHIAIMPSTPLYLVSKKQTAAHISTNNSLFEELTAYFPDISSGFPINAQPKIISHKGTTYEIISSILNHQVIGDAPIIRFVTDISHLTQAQAYYQTKLRIMATIGFILSMIFLWIAIAEPFNRIKKIGLLIPDIGKKDSPWTTRTELRALQRLSSWPDESDIICNSTITLSERLELSQSRLRYRSHLVEQRKQQLMDEKALSEALINTAQVMVIILDKDLRIRRINQHGSRLIGLPIDSIEMQTVEILHNASEDISETIEQLKKMVNGKLDHFQHQTTFVTSRGIQKHIAWFYARVTDASHEYCISSVGFDVSDRKRIEEHITWLADRDPLTTLINRRRLLEELERAVNVCKRYHHHCALLIIDIDRFRDLNDTRGHLAGDNILKKVSNIISNKCHETELLARIGGDQFAILLEESNIDQAKHLAERIKKALCDAPVLDDEPELRVSISIGIALHPEHTDNSRELLEYADLATYKAKEKGHNQFCIYDHHDQTKNKVRERVFWNEQVQQAIHSDSICMLYQPIRHVDQSIDQHFEALLRIKTDNGKLLAPSELIQAAERSHLIYQLDAKILNIVLQDLSSLVNRGIHVTFSINISGLSFQNNGLLIHLKKLLGTYKIPPNNIILEITETAAVTDIQASIRLMREFKELGVMLALDDFGVGFSSIYYLKQFPIDYLKIDGSFIQHLTTDENNQILVKAAIEVAQAFKLQTVAEFVEDQQTLDLLRDMGADYVQGYHIGEPETLENIKTNTVSD
jgi:diguanylate cyclase (GGDEF)-like protein/PAS domain S-box-containing protein